jgi:hypothetical protein
MPLRIARPAPFLLLVFSVLLAGGSAHAEGYPAFAPGFSFFL